MSDKDNSYKGLKLIVIGSIVVVAILWGANYWYGMQLDHVHRGIFGDMFGAINSVFSGLAFGGIIISLYMQRIDLKNQKEQLKLNYEEIQQTNKEFKIQNKTLQIQKFENQFYKMIDLHKQNVRDLVIPYDNTKELKGVKCFVDMFKELEFILKEVKHVNSNHDNLNIDNAVLEQFAYKLFFFGIDSEFCTMTGVSDGNLRVFKEHFKRSYSAFVNKRNNIVEVPDIRYKPFKGQESKLAQYYRHLFQTVKYVVKQETNNIIDYDEARQYLRVLRSQMSNAEQLLIYYNYRCGFGSNWDVLGNRGYQFPPHYRLIHNIPLDRVKMIESPRAHFKEFIQNNDEINDPLFEWDEFSVDDNLNLQDT